MGTAFSCSVLPSPPLPNSEFILAVTTHTHRATILPTAPTTVLADAGNFKPQPLSCGDHLRHYDPLAITNTPAIRNELDSKPRIGHQNTRRLGLLSLSVLLH